MNQEASKLLQQVPFSNDAGDLRRLRELLSDSETRVLPSAHFLARTSTLVDIWSVRSQNAVRNGNRLEGVDALLRQLRTMPDEHKVILTNVVGNSQAAALFFDAENDHFLGSVLVEMSDYTKAYFRGELKNDVSGHSPDIQHLARTA